MVYSELRNGEDGLKTNQLYIDNHITMKAAYSTPDPHKHLALHLILALGEPLDCMIEGEHVLAQAIMIAADVTHTVKVVKGDTIVFLFEAVSTLGQNMRQQYLKDRPYYILPGSQSEQLLALYMETAGDLREFDEKACTYLKLWERPVHEMDPRIQAILSELSQMNAIPENVFSYACSMAGLSKSRFSHLFKDNTGMAFRRYLVLLKLQIAYNGYLSGKSITDIAMDSGFDSPSHFANTMHRMFGISASDFRNTMNES